jgi:hypothetical protein
MTLELLLLLFEHFLLHLFFLIGLFFFVFT